MYLHKLPLCHVCVLCAVPAAMLASPIPGASAPSGTSGLPRTVTGMQTVGSPCRLICMRGSHLLPPAHGADPPLCPPAWPAGAIQAKNVIVKPPALPIFVMPSSDGFVSSQPDLPTTAVLYPTSVGCVQDGAGKAFPNTAPNGGYTPATCGAYALAQGAFAYGLTNGGTCAYGSSISTTTALPSCSVAATSTKSVNTFMAGSPSGSNGEYGCDPASLTANNCNTNKCYCVHAPCPTSTRSCSYTSSTPACTSTCSDASSLCGAPSSQTCSGSSATGNVYSAYTFT